MCASGLEADKKRLTKELESLKPKIEFYGRLLDSSVYEKPMYYSHNGSGCLAYLVLFLAFPIFLMGGFIGLCLWVIILLILILR